jgi:hypothetical protein
VCGFTIELDLFSTTTAEPRDGGEGFLSHTAEQSPKQAHVFDFAFYSLYHDFSSPGFLESKHASEHGAWVARLSEEKQLELNLHLRIDRLVN